MKNFKIFIACFLTIFKLTTSSWIDCIFESIDSFKLGSLNTCKVQNDLNIFSVQNRVINYIRAVASDEPKIKEDDEIYNNVLGFHSNDNKVHYFPIGIDKYFKNLKYIFIEHGRLKVIKREDLAPFNKLEVLVLGNSDIQVLEDGLFSNNPSLTFNSFWSASIFHIDQKVFRSLNKLSSLWLNANKCINKDASDSTAKVKDLITAAKTDCNDLDFINFRKSFNELDAKILAINEGNFKNFDNQLKATENAYKNSKFSSIVDFNLQKLKNDLKYLHFSNKFNVESRFDSIDYGQTNLKNDIQKCLKSCNSDVLTNIQSLGTSLQSTIGEVTTLSGQISKINCKVKGFETEQKKQREDLESSIEAGKVWATSLIHQKIGELNQATCSCCQQLNAGEHLLEPRMQDDGCPRIDTIEDKISTNEHNIQELNRKVTYIEKVQKDSTTSLTETVESWQNYFQNKIDWLSKELKDESNLMEITVNRTNQFEAHMNHKMDTAANDFRKLLTDSEANTSKQVKKFEEDLNKIESKIDQKVKVIENQLKDTEARTLKSIDQKLSQIEVNFKASQPATSMNYQTLLNELQTRMDTKVTQKVAEVDKKLKDTNSKVTQIEKKLSTSELKAAATAKVLENSINLVKSQLNTGVLQKVTEIDKKFKDLELKLKESGLKTSKTIETQLTTLESKTNATISQKSSEFDSKLTDTDSKTLKTIDGKVNSLESKINSRIDGKFRDLDKKVKDSQSGALKALKDQENRINSKIGALEKKFKDSEVQKSAELTQKSIKFQNETLMMIGDKVEGIGKKVKQTEDTFTGMVKIIIGELKGTDDSTKQIDQPEIKQIVEQQKTVNLKLEEQNESMLKLNDTVEYIHEDLSHFKSGIRLDLEKIKNEDNNQKYLVLSKIDQMLKRIQNLEKELDVLKQNKTS